MSTYHATDHTAITSPGPARTEWSGACALIVAGSGETDLAEALRAGLVRRGARAEVSEFPDAPPPGPAPCQPFTHVLAVLPRAACPEGDGRTRLARVVRRLRAAALTPMNEGGFPGGSLLSFIQFGGGNFGTGPLPADPETCCAASFARSLHLERPDLRVRVIDLDATLAAGRAAELALGELAGAAGFAAAGFDADGVRRVPRARLQQPAAYTPRGLKWSSGDVVLVTGGAKGITAECARALAQSTGVKLALVGSSPAPAPGSEGELTRTLERFRAEGLTCRYYACDLTDGAAVAGLVRRVRQELGPVTGVVHGAGVNKPRRLEQVSAEEALAEISPKLLGALHLCQALAQAPPKLFIGFTSIIGVTGMPGNAWYAFSNEALDLVLRNFEAEHPQTAVLSIAYSVWGETGMGARMGSVKHLAARGIGAIPTEEGVRRFLQLFEADPGVKQVVVTARLAGLDTWPVAPPPAPAGLRFVDRVVRSHPGVELVTRTRLTLERDRYVADHVYSGSYLFPTVFGLEAMAQAAAYLTGEEQPAVLRIEDVSLERPIVVDPQLGVEIEVHAEALEATPAGERPVRVGIRTEQTGFAVDHFAAVLVLGAPADGPATPLALGAPLDLDPKADLYGGLLFQGPLFQKMGRIYELDGDHAVLESASGEAGALAAQAFTPGQGGRLLLGDPFFRDVLLQTGQLTIPQETCLPVRIERIERFRAPASDSSRRIIFAPSKVRKGREYVAEIFTTDEQGRVLERLTGYRLRILEEHPENPTAEELVNPAGRDARLLREALAGGVKDLGLRLPAVALAALPGLHGLPKEERHRHELPVIEQALRAKLGLGVEPACPFEVGRLPSGKPQFGRAPAPELELSLAHDDRSCLCVVGTGPQGCDLAPVSPRTGEDWAALLGEGRGGLLAELAAGGDESDRAGTRVWAAVEAVRKATGAADVELLVEGRRGPAVVLRAGPAEDAPRVVTVPVRLTRGPERLVAVVAEGSPPRRPAPAPVTGGINPDWHCVRVAEDGPQGQPVQELRFVVSFQESSGLSRRVPASRYLTWMGKMRELVTSANVPGLVAQITTGDWGLVTNWADVRVTGEATANDVIQMRFWTDRPRGSEVEFCCDFWKVQPDGRAERVAFGEQKATWVRLTGHGQVAPEPLPPALAEFIERMGPQIGQSHGLPALPEPLSELKPGKAVYTAPAGPGGGRLLWAETVRTTLEEANLVGNVYFANYFAWQGRVRDQFLHAVDPTYLRGVGGRGELVCLRSRVDYLREAMPFDVLEVVLSLRSLSECGAVFGFEYYRLLPEGGRQKLSVGWQEVVWVERRADGRPVAVAFPRDIRRALLEAPPLAQEHCHGNPAGSPPNGHPARDGRNESGPRSALHLVAPAPARGSNGVSKAKSA
jgi:NAD(P)-dependent dehydrogenase (short-subunit alcohol dehydrogenase family)/acyl-CoA thioesterase FadM